MKRTVMLVVSLSGVKLRILVSLSVLTPIFLAIEFSFRVAFEERRHIVLAV